MWASLKEKIAHGTATVGIIGLGYVGLPLGVAFSRKFTVLGFDIRPDLVQAIGAGNGRTQGVSPEEISRALKHGFVPTTDFQRLAECDAVIIAVGTPLTERQDPDLSQVEGAAREVAKRLRRGQFIVLESTSYPGTTEEVLVPILAGSGLRPGVDFGVAYSPERIDPGNTELRVEQIPKLVGGIDEASTEVGVELYRQVVETVVPVSHARVAEAAKIIENLFRAVNIALINEVALILERLDVDTWEAVRAAATKPFGYMPFFPGPGIGGHCIPLDPYYLSYRARKAGFMPRFIELSGETNEYMKFHTVDLLRRGLKEAKKVLSGSTVAILGLAFKRNVGDTRESPAVRIIDECLREGARVRAFDPRAPSIVVGDREIRSEPDVQATVADADGAVILVDHDEFRAYDYDALSRGMSQPAVWVDARHLLERAPRGSIALGIGRPDGRVPAKAPGAKGAREPARTKSKSR